MRRHGKASRKPGKRARSSRWWRKVAVLAAGSIAIAAVVAAVSLSVARSGEESKPSAAIVDHLSLTFPNPDFVEATTATLEEAGYAVDYYPGEEVTVDFYRDLPTHGYDLLILRVHSARIHPDWRERFPDQAVLFTSEPYTVSKYLEEQMAGHLLEAYSQEGAGPYFGIGSGFIESDMRGDLKGATVVIMGCHGLYTDATAEAFLKRGAKAVVGWDGYVSASYTDEATERLLQHLLRDNLTVREAIRQVTAEVGPDPSYGSTLLSLPDEP